MHFDFFESALPQKSYSDFDVKIRKLSKYNISYKKRNAFPVIRCQCIIIKRYNTANLVHYHVIALHCLRISSNKKVYLNCSYKTITILVKGTTFYFHKKNTLRTMSSPRSINNLSSS